MRSYAKGKFILFLSTIIALALIVLIGFQLVNIAKTKIVVAKQQSQIETLNNEKDYHENYKAGDYGVNSDILEG